MRDVIGKYIPDNISKATKQGFSAPDASWFKGESIDFVRKIIFDDNSKIYDYLNKETIQNLVLRHLNGQENKRLLIWSLLNIETYLLSFPENEIMIKQSIKKSKLLITGGNGLLGKQLIPLLLEDYEIYSILRKKPDSILKNVEYLYIDLSTQWNTSILPNDIDIIIHLAQSSKFRDFPSEAEDIFNVNIKSTAQLLDFARKNNIQKFVYASSGGIYGTNSNRAFNESSPITATDQLGFYLGSKLCGEVLVRNYSTLFDVITLRFFFMYGPKQHKTMLIPRLISKVRNNDSIILTGYNGIKINPINVDDAKKAVQNTLSLDGSYVFNIGGSEVYSIREIAEVIGDTFGKKPIFEIVDEKAKDLIGDITGMKNKLYIPKIDFHKGIKSFIL